MDPNPPPQDDCLPRVARGEADAVGECLRRYTPLVWSIARRLSKDPSTVEDVVQEVFVDLWRSAARFDAHKASEATFIATIARRRVIDRSRKLARAPEREDIDEVQLAASEPGFRRVELGDEAARAHAVLETLKPDQRKVILMSVVDQLTHQEIAGATGLPLGTVKSHIRRGLDKAARLLRAAREGGGR